jgi:hypothetical protein
MISPMQTALEPGDHSSINEYTTHFFNNFLKLYNANTEHYPGEKLRVCINTIDQLQKQSSETKVTPTVIAPTAAVAAIPPTPPTAALVTPPTPPINDEDNAYIVDQLNKLKTYMTDYKKDQSIEHDEEIQNAIQIYTILDNTYGPNNPAPKEFSSLLNEISSKYQSLTTEPEKNIWSDTRKEILVGTSGGKPSNKRNSKQKQKKQSKRISYIKKHKTRKTRKNRKTKKSRKSRK